MNIKVPTLHLILYALVIIGWPCSQIPSTDMRYFRDINRRFLDTARMHATPDTQLEFFLRRLELLTGRLDINYTVQPKFRVISRTNGATNKYTILRIEYENLKKQAIPSLLLLPPDDGKLKPGVVVFHQTTPYGKDEPAGLKGDKDLAYGHELAEKGFAVMVPDYPGFGENHHVDTLRGNTASSLENHILATSLIANFPGIDSGRLGAIGHSLGGHNALLLAAVDRRIRAVVTNCGWTPFPYYMGGDLTTWASPHYMPSIETHFKKARYGLPIDFYDLIAMTFPRALLSLSPRDDDNFLYTGVQQAESVAIGLYRQAGKSNSIQFQYPAGGHSFTKETREIAYRFLNDHLQ